MRYQTGAAVIKCALEASFENCSFNVETRRERRANPKHLKRAKQQLHQLRRKLEKTTLARVCPCGGGKLRLEGDILHLRVGEAELFCGACQIPVNAWKEPPCGT